MDERSCFNGAKGTWWNGRRTAHKKK